MSFRVRDVIVPLFCMLFTSGCFQERTAVGVRVNITEQNSVIGKNVTIKLPKQVTLANWGGLALKNLNESQNFSLKPNVKQSWILNTGVKSFSGAPVILNNKIIFFSTSGDLICIDLASKRKLWSFSLQPEEQTNKKIIGGGLSFDGEGNVYVTTSFGEVLSFIADSGILNWRHEVDAPIMDPPTVAKESVFITDALGTSQALSLTGKLNWSVEGSAEVHIWPNPGRPIHFDNLLLISNSTGVLAALDPLSGFKLWQFEFNSQKAGYAENTFGTFNGSPGVFDDVIYYGSTNGQFNALSKFGDILWQISIGLHGSPLVIANSIYFTTDTNELVRLDRNSGRLIWSKRLSTSGISTNYFSPILAGSKLWLTGSDTYLRSFDVNSGKMIDEISIGSKSEGPPIYYSGSIIVYTKSGTLVAFK